MRRARCKGRKKCRLRREKAPLEAGGEVFLIVEVRIKIENGAKARSDSVGLASGSNGERQRFRSHWI